ncbi:MAG: ribbon-helix-helix protein, CopG family [Chloroflexi bacterium]|nr:ribbon-helix-helix protein, CopG family [Chloroflexota bacterium]
MAQKNIKRSLAMSQEMHDLLLQVAAKRGREVSVSDLIREAIRQFLDQQADLVGSRRHFQKSLQGRIDRLERALTFHLHILIHLMADENGAAIEEAIIAARRDGAALLEQIAAVRELETDP